MNCTKFNLVTIIFLFLIFQVQIAYPQENDSPSLEDITGTCDLSVDIQTTQWLLNFTVEFLNPKLHNATIDYVSLELVDVFFIGEGRQIFNEQIYDSEIYEKILAKTLLA